MRNEQITKDNQKMVGELLERVQSMSKEEYKNILNSMATFHNYSYSNQIILHFSGASQVAGFRSWTKDHNRTVKKGAKAVWILAPNEFLIPIEKYNGKAQMIDIIKKNGKEYAKLMSYKSVPVFDIADTEGEEIVKNMTTTSKIELETLKSIADTLGYCVSNKPLEIATGGYIAEKSIVLNSNLSEAENIGTLIHELAHGELGHTDSKDMTSRSLKEQQAETVTYIICQMFGVDRKSEFYLKGWRLDENINNSFSLINKAVSTISEMIEKYQ
jgi:hypothetical protein